MVYKTLYVAAIVNANTCIAEKKHIFAIYIHQGKHDFVVITVYLRFHIVHEKKISINGEYSLSQRQHPSEMWMRAFRRRACVRGGNIAGWNGRMAWS